MKTIEAMLATCLILAAAVGGPAQSPAPKPGPEQERLSYFLGSWHGDGEMKPSPLGTGGKYTETEEAEWLPGGFFLLIHSFDKTPEGDFTTLMVLGYDSSRKVYTFNAYDSAGETETATGTFEADTWTWLSEFNMGGTAVKTRFIMKQLSPTSYSVRFESSPDGKTWTSIMEGKNTRAK